MSELADVKLIDLTEVFCIRAETPWYEWASLGRVVGATTQNVTVNAARISTMSDINPIDEMAPYAATYLKGNGLRLYTKETRAEIIKKVEALSLKP